MVAASPAVMRGVGAAAARFLYLLPALLLALLCLRVAELGAGLSAGSTFTAAARIVAPALTGDLFALASHLPLLFLFSLPLPLLLIRSRSGMFWALGLAWSSLVAAQAALVHYFIMARVPLGADLFAYSLRDINDYAALMDYRDHAQGRDGIVRHAMAEMECADRHNKKLVIGVEVTPNEIRKVSFNHLAEADLERELALTENALSGYRTFSGFAIHHFRGYQEWLAHDRSGN